MAKGIVCDSCGKFESGEGYSVRIYKNVTRVGRNGFAEPRSYRVVTKNDICYECASKVAGNLGESLEDIIESKEEQEDI